MRRVRIGVVGAGLVAQVVHLPRLAELEDRFEVVALAEPDDAVRARVALRYGIGVVRGPAARRKGIGAVRGPAARRGGTVCGNHRELIADGAAEAVLVCSPDPTHAEIVLDSLAAGLHVLVEKPLCLTTEDADRIIAARDRAECVVHVGYMKRFDPAYEALELPHELLHVATTTYDPGLAAEFGPPGAVDRPADPFLGALVHDVNAVHGLIGPINARAVDGFTRPDGRAAGGTVELDTGARWTLTWLRIDGLGDFRQHLALYGRDDIRELEFPAPYLHKAPTVYRYRTRGGVTHERRSWQEAYVRQLEHFHDCVTAGTPCRTPPEQARADIELLTQLRELAT